MKGESEQRQQWWKKKKEKCGKKKSETKKDWTKTKNEAFMSYFCGFFKSEFRTFVCLFLLKQKTTFLFTMVVSSILPTF